MTVFIRILLFIAIIVGLAFVGLQVFKPQIGQSLFERAIENQAGVDRSADLPDGLHVYVCGSGSPLGDPTREGPCLAVLAGQKAFVFDVGSGTPRNLGLMGFPLDRLETVYLTHLHSDHIDSLGELLMQAWIIGGRDTPLPVVGPVGVEEVVEGFNLAYRLDGTYRTAHHGVEIANPTGRGGAPLAIEITEGDAEPIVLVSDGDLRITAIRVDHAPVEPAFGFRIDYKDRSISLSGDTIYHAGFIAASEGVDIMFHEALDPEMVGQIQQALAARGNRVGAKIFADIPDYHATPEDAARAAELAGAGRLVYYHIVPALPAKLIEPVFLGSARKEFSGPLEIGQDGMIYSLPAGSDEMTVQKGL